MAAKKMTLKRRIRREKQKNRMILDDNEVLPSDIIMYDILTRIPTESFMRFRCICKQWHDLKWDPLFIDLRRSYNIPGVIFKSFRRFVFFDINTKREKTIWSPIMSDDFPGILYSLNGLLLISTRLYGHYSKPRECEYFVYNPTTRNCSENLPKLVFDDAIHDCDHFCLAYDSIIGKYKVVCFTRTYHGEYFCRILTLGVDNSWRDVVIPKSVNLEGHLECRPVFANGSLHVLMWRDEGRFNDKVLVSLDVSSETFYTISLPKCEYRILLQELYGLLCCVHCISSTELKLWVLNEDVNNDKHEWVEKCRIDFRQSEPLFRRSLLDGFNLFAILGYPKSIKLILQGYKAYVRVYHYYSYDMKLKQLDYICERRDTPFCFHVNSLTNF